MLFRNDKKDEKEPRSGPARVPLLPLRDIIVFPHMVVPLFVGRQRSIKALEEATPKAEARSFCPPKKTPRRTSQRRKISIRSVLSDPSCKC